ncbi:uncharacterized protein LOC115627900 [Scaptodrosophila lebanonensis]|uniref:Uncharacterized protein LOC115627900 n=1 Tax=Drosophila lebanonensis TaxID=7225 RepID=A0A6J2TU92_DROLE|nr:uncharacterized protein LOC115627900 [Scaptodrosophila lebanonensis]
MSRGFHEAPLLCLLLLIATLALLPPTSTTRVIYFNKPETTTVVDRSMLLDIQSRGCRPGFMRDHHNRCRRIV